MLAACYALPSQDNIPHVVTTVGDSILIFAVIAWCHDGSGSMFNFAVGKATFYGIDIVVTPFLFANLTWHQRKRRERGCPRRAQ